MIPIRPPSGVPSPAGPTSTTPSLPPPTTGSPRCCGGPSERPTRATTSGRTAPSWARLADSFRMEALLLIPRAVALAVRPLTDAGLEPVVFKGPPWRPATPSPGSGRWRTSTSCCPAPTTTAR